MMKKILFSIAVIAGLASSVRAHSLTYAGMLVRANPTTGVLEPCTNVTNVSRMTVSLHTWTNDADQVLWNYSYDNVPVSDGAFSVTLEGWSYGLDTTYRTLDAVLAARAGSRDLCVSVTDICGTGLEGVQPEVAHGRLTAVPFALAADCGLQAKKTFRISGGNAVVHSLAVQGDVQVSGKTTFADEAKFSAHVSTASLDVTGPLSRETLTNVGTFDAQSLTVTEGLTASVAVNAQSARLSSAKSATFQRIEAETVRTKAVTAKELAASTLKVTGKVTVPSLEWTGDLTVDGSPIDDEKAEKTAVRTAKAVEYAKLKGETSSGGGDYNFWDYWLNMWFPVAVLNILDIFGWFDDDVAQNSPTISVISYKLKDRSRSSMCAVPVTPMGGSVACGPVSGSNSWTHVSGNANNHMTVTVLVPMAAGNEELIAVSDTTFSMLAPRWRELSK